MTDDDGYAGPAVLETGGRSFALTVRLAGYFQPLDGHYRWYGRVEADRGLSELVGSGRADVVLQTSQGRAAGSLGDLDLWNRYRIEGLGMPPFRVPVTVEEIDGEAR
jgi:hypothetical protein